MSEVDERARRRRLERHGAAAVRAVSGRADAEWRGRSLEVGRDTVPIATPYLIGSLDQPDGTLDEQRVRGVADGLGMRLRHSDVELHASSAPEPVLDRIIFDALEQLRCESLTPSYLRGQRANLVAAFEAWSLDARTARVAESRTSLVVFTLLHMVHARLMARAMSEDVEGLIEATRFYLAPLIGNALRELATERHDQVAYAAAAVEIARLIAEAVGETDDSTASESAVRHRLSTPMSWGLQEQREQRTNGQAASIGDQVLGGSEQSSRFDDIGDYRAFTTDFDREVAGDSLYRPAKLHGARSHLDALVRAQAVSIPRLAARLLAMFGGPTADGWAFGVDDGVLDGRRLGQLVANPANREVFRSPREQPASRTAITFLLDNSGSMKRQRFEAAAVLVDTFSRALDMAGITNEVLGFTTDAWAGGRTIEAWRAAGEPPAPGRMNEALHIVYKAAEARWKSSRMSLAALVHPLHFREGLDGEALAWAHGRLATRPERRRVLVMITDGSPADSATANLNRPGFLDDHLTGVASRIERHHLATGRGVELASIDIDEGRSSLSAGGAIRRSVDLDLSDTLTLAHFGALYELLA